ncbi:MAG TPA: undecaprenyl-diphosphate phosphatase [Acidobacteriota bacterium]
MTALQAIALAVVQGITEFFPISSSAHLILMPRLMRWQDQGLPFDIATHCGTLLAILIYFRADLVRVGRGWIASLGAPAPGDAETGRLGWALLLGTVPAAIAGLALRDLIATEARNPLLIACTSIGYGLLMGWADRGGSRRRALESVGLQDGLIIGLAQALALVPGTSRSGITITAALLLGFQRPAAARFSFLLAVPVSLLVAADDALQFWMGRISASELVPMALGLLVSALVGYLVIAALLGWLRRRSLLVFTLYRVGLGLAIFTTLWLGG